MSSKIVTESNPLRRVLPLAAAALVVIAAGPLFGESANPAPGDKVLATVDGVPITEAHVLESAAGAMLALERQRHQLIVKSLEGEIFDLLVKNEAKKRGIDEEELLKIEVEDKATELPAERVDAFYQQQSQQRRGQMPPKEQIEKQIREFLAFQDFDQRLRAAAKIEQRLEPFRVEVAANGPKKGPDSAPVTIVEFSDFECPYCNRVVPTLAKVRETYGDKVRIVFRQFPLEAIHPNAKRASEASLCAHEQGKFWEFHDAMFADQSKLAGDGLIELATAVDGLDAEQLGTCLESGKYTEQVERDLTEGQAAGVTGTPAFFINGRFRNGALTFEQLKEIIDEELGG